MLPPELYWPPELLAKALPDRYGHLVAKPAPSQGAAGRERAAASAPRSYAVEPVAGGCRVIRPAFGAGIRFRERKAP